jgi:CRP-like cAMP-binding protein
MANDDLIQKLGKCALFEDLSHKELAGVADRMAEDHFPAGQTILREGEEGMGFFFVVLDGTATVKMHGEVIATLTPGSFFGEITALNGGPRTASVTTDQPLWALRLTDANFRPFLEDFPRITFRILEQVAKRYQGLAINA